MARTLSAGEILIANQMASDEISERFPNLDTDQRGSSIDLARDLIHRLMIQSEQVFATDIVTNDGQVISADVDIDSLRAFVRQQMDENIQVAGDGTPVFPTAQEYASAEQSADPDRADRAIEAVLAANASLAEATPAAEPAAEEGVTLESVSADQLGNQNEAFPTLEESQRAREAFEAGRQAVAEEAAGPLPSVSADQLGSQDRAFPTLEESQRAREAFEASRQAAAEAEPTERTEITDRERSSIEGRVQSYMQQNGLTNEVMRETMVQHFRDLHLQQTDEVNTIEEKRGIFTEENYGAAFTAGQQAAFAAMQAELAAAEAVPAGPTLAEAIDEDVNAGIAAAQARREQAEEAARPLPPVSADQLGSQNEAFPTLEESQRALEAYEQGRQTDDATAPISQAEADAIRAEQARLLEQVNQVIPRLQQQIAAQAEQITGLEEQIANRDTTIAEQAQAIADLEQRLAAANAALEAQAEQPAQAPPAVAAPAPAEPTSAAQAPEEPDVAAQAGRREALNGLSQALGALVDGQAASDTEALRRINDFLQANGQEAIGGEDGIQDREFLQSDNAYQLIDRTTRSIQDAMEDGSLSEEEVTGIANTIRSTINEESIVEDVDGQADDRGYDSGLKEQAQDQARQAQERVSR